MYQFKVKKKKKTQTNKQFYTLTHPKTIKITWGEKYFHPFMFGVVSFLLNFKIEQFLSLYFGNEQISPTNTLLVALAKSYDS